MGDGAEGIGAEEAVVRTERDTIVIERMTLRDAELAQYVSERPEEDRTPTVERALRVGLIALRNAGTTVNVDYIARELARVADPRREDSPMHGFRGELRESLKDVGDRLLRLEAAREARAEERERGTAKGGDFEDEVGVALASLLHASGDVVEPTGCVVGNSVRSKKGDYLITANPTWTQGLRVRIAVEAKDRRIGLAPLCRELDEARVNRDAAVAMAVYRVGDAPPGCAPFTLHGEHVICELDPDEPKDAGFEAAVRLARALALAAVRGRADVVDAASVRRDLDGIRAQVQTIRAMKAKLSSISTATQDVSAQLESMREAVLECVASIEANVTDDGSGQEVA